MADNKLTDEIKQKLLPYQIPHTETLIKILEKHNRVLDSSDTGSGKSYCAAAAALALNLKPLIICPKSVISSWKKVLDAFNCNYYGISNYESIQNCKYYTKVSGKNKVKCPFIKRTEDTNVVVVDDKKVIKKEEKKEENKEPTKLTGEKLKQHLLQLREKRLKRFEKEKEKIKQEIQEFKDAQEEQEKTNGSLPPPPPKIQKKNGKNYIYQWLIPDDCIVIVDEAHKCKNLKTIASVLLYTLSNTMTTSVTNEEKCKIIMLSATIADKPSNFALCGYVLGLYPSISKASGWINKIAGETNDNPMLAVHHVLFNEHAARMRIKELGDLFPKNSVKAECFDMDCSELIQKEYKLIEDAIEHLKKKEESSTAIAAIQFARMKIEMFKVPTYIELANKYLEEGCAVAIFVNFTDSLRHIAQELKTNCIVYGQQTIEERNKNIDDFQADKEHVIVLNSASGGTGLSLHDLNGNYPRVAIISPSYSAISVLQVLGRIFRANGKTPARQLIVYCSDTIEESICENMKEKIINIALINDGETDSYKIEGLMDDNKDNDKLSDFDKAFLKMNALHAKKERLEQDLIDTNKEIKELENIINNWF